MHLSKNDLAVKIDAPGAHARHQPDFGAAAGTLAAEYFTLGAGADLAPLLAGLDHDSCHSAHWGFMVAGDVVVTYDDGRDERCSVGDLFYWPPGHSVRVETDAELVMFSPQLDHGPVLDHLLAKMSAGG
jgi:mannose-6-phosphate isomerase-like protein (cupin superfamily)